jgi:hypothetical protein
MSITLMNRLGIPISLVLLAGCMATASPSESHVAPASVLPAPSQTQSSDPAATHDICAVTRVDVATLMSASEDFVLDCLSSRSLSLRAYVSGMVGAGSCTATPIPGDGWLNLCAGDKRVLVEMPGDEEGIVAYIPPALDTEVPFERWVEVRGHFDDRAAQTCDRLLANGEPAHDPAELRACRLAFVLESAQVLP